MCVDELKLVYLDLCDGIMKFYLMICENMLGIIKIIFIIFLIEDIKFILLL